MPPNVETMMYHGKKPWNGLGTPLLQPATAAQAIEAASLGWTVELHPVLSLGTIIPHCQGVVRMDRLEPLAVVGRRYVPIQNAEAFAFFDQVVGEGHAIYETAGAIDRGRRIWLLARIPGDLWVTHEDNVGKYLLLTNSHDGRSPLRALFTPIRVVCENTLRAALQGGESGGVSIRHVGNIHEKVREARRVLGLSVKYYDAFGEQAGAFVRRELSSAEVIAYFKSLVPDPVAADPAQARGTRETLGRLFESGKGNALPSVRGTVWAALNAVTELIDHERPTRARGAGNEDAQRWKSAQFGSGARLREEAWKGALGLLG